MLNAIAAFMVDLSNIKMRYNQCILSASSQLNDYCMACFTAFSLGSVENWCGIVRCELIVFHASVPHGMALHVSCMISQLVWMFVDYHQNFGRDLFERLRRAIQELIVLNQYCLEGGEEAVEKMIQARLVSGRSMLVIAISVN